MIDINSFYLSKINTLLNQVQGTVSEWKYALFFFVYFEVNFMNEQGAKNGGYGQIL